MRTPTDLDLENLAHEYDPQKAHEYYMKVRQLKGRKKGVSDTVSTGVRRAAAPPPPKAKRAAVPSPAKAKQKAELHANVTNLQDRLHKLEELIKQKEAVVKRNAQRSKQAARNKDKPKTAADKAKAARDNAKYRDKHKQELKNKAKKADAKSGGGAKEHKPDSKKSISELKSLATKVKGQLAVAKQKLAAL
jgi:Tfp pilus assembly protein FimV